MPSMPQMVWRMNLLLHTVRGSEGVEGCAAWERQRHGSAELIREESGHGMQEKAFKDKAVGDVLAVEPMRV